ncbi:hypothetical protein HispidOSU_026222 [Sigmodon hispidus]
MAAFAAGFLEAVSALMGTMDKDVNMNVLLDFMVLIVSTPVIVRMEPVVIQQVDSVLDQQVSMATIVNENVHLECLETIVISLVTVKEKALAIQSQENASVHQGGQEPGVKQNARQATMDQTACCCVNARKELTAIL